MEQRRSKYAYDKEYYRSVSEQLRNVNGNSYLDGSTARQLYALPDYEEDEEYYPPQQPVRERREERQGERRRRSEPRPEPRVRVRKVRNIDFKHMLVIIMAISALVFSSYRYLEAQSELTQINKEINAMENSISSLQDKNDAVRSALSIPYDPDYIFAAAVSRLGMVYPDKNRVLEYERSESGYVRQYGEIPEQK